MTWRQLARICFIFNMNLLSLHLFWMCCNAINFVLLRFEFCSLWLASNIPLDIPLKYFFSSEHSNRSHLVILSKKEKGHHFSVKKIKKLHFFETTVCIVRKLRRKKKDNVIAKKLFSFYLVLVYFLA